jgi:hypothetical protein
MPTNTTQHLKTTHGGRIIYQNELRWKKEKLCNEIFLAENLSQNFTKEKKKWTFEFLKEKRENFWMVMIKGKTMQWRWW